MADVLRTHGTRTACRHAAHARGDALAGALPRCYAYASCWFRHYMLAHGDMAGNAGTATYAAYSRYIIRYTCLRYVTRSEGKQQRCAARNVIHNTRCCAVVTARHMRLVLSRAGYSHAWQHTCRRSGEENAFAASAARPPFTRLPARVTNW